MCRTNCFHVSHLRLGLAGCQAAQGFWKPIYPYSHRSLVGAVLAADQKVQHLDTCLHVISPQDYFTLS